MQLENKEPVCAKNESFFPPSIMNHLIHVNEMNYTKMLTKSVGVSN